MQNDSKKYNKIKLVISLTETVIGILFILFILFFGYSKAIANFSQNVFNNIYLALLMYAFILGIIETVLTFPLSFYSGYYLEHKYSLSNQTFFQWIWEGLKAVLVGVVIATPLLLIFYYFLRNYSETWWLWVAVFFTLFSVVLARLAPIIIFPIFYKFEPIKNEELKNKLLKLCEDVKLYVNGVFVFNMSKDTKKANAGFTGIGKSKRIVIADTLLENFSNDEMESVFVHELGHYKYKHIWKGIAIGTLNTFIGLYLVSIIYKNSIDYFDFKSIDDMSALPLIGLYLSLLSLILMPVGNAISRFHENEADKYALQNSSKSAFISAMEKLRDMNLADENPHPLVEFWFHSHPSIKKRIERAKDF
jgi:STE24 endopeptidase